ncbi:hypothetical protein MCEMAEM4_03368 [Burkholderiaceae bacterium]
MQLHGVVLNARLRRNVHQAKTDAFSTNAIQAAGLLSKRLRAIDAVRSKADKHIDVVTADGEPFQTSNRGTRAVDHVAKAALLEANRAAHINEF